MQSIFGHDTASVWNMVEDEANAYDEHGLGGKPMKKSWFGLGPYKEKDTYSWRKSEWRKREKNWTLEDNPAYERYKAMEKAKQEEQDRKIRRQQEAIDNFVDEMEKAGFTLSDMYEGVDPMIDPSDMDRVIANGR